MMNVVRVFLLLLVGMFMSSVAGGAAAEFPKNLSDMQGWRGMKVERADKGGRALCRVEFPAEFGGKSEELVLLAYLVSQGSRLVGNDGCRLSAQAAHKALDQLLYMALLDKSAEAAGIIVNRGLPSFKFNLDGEVGEMYGENYLMPLLEKTNHPCELLQVEATQRVVAEEVCGEVQFRAGVGDMAFLSRARALGERLHNCGAKVGARGIQNCVAESRSRR